MTKNESAVDRIIRLIVAIALAVASYVWLSGYWQIAGYVVAVIILITAITGFCGLYKALGISTAKKSDEEDKNQDQADSTKEASDIPETDVETQPSSEENTETGEVETEEEKQ